MKQYFLVISSQTYETQKTKLDIIFENTRKIFSNVFVGELEVDELKRCEDIRSMMLDKQRDAKLMVIRLDADFSSAWYLSEDSSEYLKSIFNSIHNGTKQ